MPAQLLALTEGSNIILDKPILLFGRHPECDIQLNSRKVSRRHCCIAQVHDYLIVRDLGSTNGVRINGERVVEGRLKGGDELTIGNFHYRIYWDMPGEIPARAITRKSLDLMLEDADEPIPLDEELSMGQVLSAKPGPKTPPPRTQPQPSDPILPEELSLLPPSGTFRQENR